MTGNIRLADIADAEALLTVFHEANRDSSVSYADITLLSVLDWCEQQTRRHPLWVYEVEGNIVGWGAINAFYGLSAFDHVGETSLYVLPSFQGKGVSKSLLNMAFSHANQNGVAILMAHIAQSNNRSLAFFQREGFELNGTVPGAMRRKDESVEALLILSWASRAEDV